MQSSHLKPLGCCLRHLVFLLQVCLVWQFTIFPHKGHTTRVQRGVCSDPVSVCPPQNWCYFETVDPFIKQRIYLIKFQLTSTLTAATNARDQLHDHHCCSRRWKKYFVGCILLICYVIQRRIISLIKQGWHKESDRSCSATAEFLLPRVKISDITRELLLVFMSVCLCITCRN